MARGKHWGDFVYDVEKEYGHLIVGIDPSMDHTELYRAMRPVDFLYQSSVDIVNAAVGLVGIVKFQSAFFEREGSDGIRSLERAIAYAKENGMGVILDAKRGDIGSTALAYSEAYLKPGQSPLEVDCITVNPFLGPDSMEPWLRYAREFGKGVFVLVRTSNPDSIWLQNKTVGDMTVSEFISDSVQEWALLTTGSSGLGAVGAVVGATFPQLGCQLRQRMPNAPFLVPGFGVQGSEAEGLGEMLTLQGTGLLISSSRGITKVGNSCDSREEYIATMKDRIIKAKEKILKRA